MCALARIAPWRGVAEAKISSSSLEGSRFGPRQAMAEDAAQLVVSLADPAPDGGSLALQATPPGCRPHSIPRPKPILDRGSRTIQERHEKREKVAP